MLSILQQWQTHAVNWWTLRDEGLLHRANPPLSSSKDEWADAVMDLSKLVVEGFETKPLRAVLTAAGQTVDPKDQTVTLLEKILITKGRAAPATLHGLRRVQHIRSKVKGHSGSSEGKALAEEALAKHGTYSQHFDHICQQVIEELQEIQNVLGL